MTLDTLPAASSMRTELYSAATVGDRFCVLQPWDTERTCATNAAATTLPETASIPEVDLEGGVLSETWHELLPLQMLSGGASRVRSRVARPARALAASASAQQIRSLVEQGNIAEARAMLGRIAARQELSADLAKWKRVLAQPTVTSAPVGTGVSMAETTAWLEQHADEYAGQWVALRGKTLLGAHQSRRELRSRLEREGKLPGALFLQL